MFAEYLPQRLLKLYPGRFHGAPHKGCNTLRGLIADIVQDARLLASWRGRPRLTHPLGPRIGLREPPE